MIPHYKVLCGFLIAATLSGILGSCTSSSTTEGEVATPTDSSVSQDSANDAINSNQSVLLNTILGNSPEGVIRGVAFGDPVSKVKGIEKFEMFEDSLRHVGFTYETDQLETIDVLYYFTPTGRQINKITVDIYLNSETATRQLWQSAKKRFTTSYGTPLEDQPRKIRWEKVPVEASMEEVSDGKDYGLKLVFTPTNKAILASR